MRTMSRYTVLPVFFALIALLLIAKAAQSAPVDGDNEVEAAAGFFHAQGSDSGSFNVDLQYGRYLTRGGSSAFAKRSITFYRRWPRFLGSHDNALLVYNFHFNDRVLRS